MGTTLLLAFALSACGEPKAEPGVEIQVVHTDEVGGAGRPDRLAPELASPLVQADGLVVWGIILVPDPCDKLLARIESDTPAVLLHVTARLAHGRRARCGIGERTTLLQYRAILGTTPPGARRLRVVHDYTLPASDPSSVRWTEHVAYDGPIDGAGRGP